ncbi:TetR/AcrR family transcriptional regulator C-terminal domain-containing protein [Pseudobacteriovorax antillogorgiicola]|uniref:Transcriptional regulator, TetR family n=1 Tax=Pseudobacteriovorax antillogorgiicola TaxID=1513793 RepID=A0A1Y6BBL6_9BACT|nr:TetR/AcrR family transcriptional regulator C-terminal domain-containing protein [Pseudobacteriovorax antillogorgiicola]TCS58773.1 TetR family transcriptional regulator [Pseudobacteriovorax antillogorgiicola]SME94903.1 transcriptional regulator, TetR family [Pseudobacteriovorax antillogorgiicola]
MAENRKKKARGKRKERHSVSREGILQHAIEIANEEGLPKVSMRRIASYFGVEAMSLYHHIQSKDEILNGMVDQILGQVSFDGEAPWQDSMRQRAESTRQVLIKNPWALGILESRPQPGPETLAYHDKVLGVLFRHGFSLALAAHTFSALDAYTYGFIMQEQALPFDNPEDLEIIAASILASFPKGAYPHLKRLTLDYILKPEYSYDKEFLYGLSLILDTLEARRKKEEDLVP